MNHGSLFSGIGGFDLAADWMGWENIFHCEMNDFGKKVLNYYWPNSISYHDITKTDFTIHRGRIDILSGGFPCQPFSAAGQRKGTDDSRHLWPEMLRAVREISPRYIVGENVRGLTNWNGGLVFDEIQANLEAEGYEILPFLLPACAVNAPHRRDRIWFVAFNTNGRSGSRNWTEQEVYEPDKGKDGTGIFKNASDSSNTGAEGLQPGRENGVYESFASSNANQRTTGSPGTSGKTKSNGSENNDEPEQRRGEAELNTGCDAVLRDVANPDKQRLQAGRKLQVTGDKKQFTRNDTKITVADSRSERLPFEGANGKLGGKFGFGECNSYKDKSTWEIFPTQSPICSGNDGLSGRLVGITFPKWRNESIKAYGNAIVPQVVLEIFKAIQKYEDSLKSDK